MLFSHNKPGPRVALLILDGWGDAPSWGGNATAAAELPTFAGLYRTDFHTLLDASGAAVGLPGHEQGNSEVGHLTIGSGRPIVQDRTKISHAIDDGTFFKNQVLRSTMERVKTSGTLHLVGLVSDGGVHSHIDHLHALLELAANIGCQKVAIHAITDGRDTPPQSASQYLDRVRHWTETLGVGQITSVIGRYWAMDRDQHWERIQLAYQLMVRGVGRHAPSVLAGIGSAYQQKETDEYIQPTWIDSGLSPIQSGDSVIMFNFRQDRSRELLTALADPTFASFIRTPLSNVATATMIPYWMDREHPGVTPVFTPDAPTDTLGSVVAVAGLSQLRIAETEKYAHVTYFLNGGTEAPFANETRQMIPSKLVGSPAQHPAMHTLDIFKALTKAVNHQDEQLMVANIASPDMVGHTGDFQAAMAACEVVDQGVAQLLAATRKHNVTTVITADHGNVEQLVNPVTNEPDTQHTTNPVPLIIDDPLGTFQGLIHPQQTLADVAPTVLTLLGLAVPHSMTGKSLGILRSTQAPHGN